MTTKIDRPVLQKTATAPYHRRRSRSYLMLLQLVTNPVTLLAAIILLLALVAAIAAPAIAPHDPHTQSLSLRLTPPIWQAGGDSQHLLGTDALGRDMLSRIIFGARVSLLVGAASVAIQGTIGILVGLVAGYYGGRIDDVAMRIADVQQAIPFLILAIAVAAILNPSLVNVIIVLGVSGWVTYGRVVRGQVLSLREREFVEAARVIGSRDRHIIFRHILPNVFASVSVIATLTISTMILAEASLSFLGLGVPVSVVTWGGMVSSGRDYLAVSWWVSVLPGLAIFFTVLSINVLGDWLREALDPTL